MITKISRMDKLPDGGRGWGVVLPYVTYIGRVPPPWVAFLSLFALKTGIHFTHFGLESGMVFEGTTGVYERIYHINSR